MDMVFFFFFFHFSADNDIPISVLIVVLKSVISLHCEQNTAGSYSVDFYGVFLHLHFMKMNIS